MCAYNNGLYIQDPRDQLGLEGLVALLAPMDLEASQEPVVHLEGEGEQVQLDQTDHLDLQVKHSIVDYYNDGHVWDKYK